MFEVKFYGRRAHVDYDHSPFCIINDVETNSLSLVFPRTIENLSVLNEVLQKIDYIKRNNPLSKQEIKEVLCQN